MSNSIIPHKKKSHFSEHNIVSLSKHIHVSKQHILLPYRRGINLYCMASTRKDLPVTLSGGTRWVLHVSQWCLV